jgi:hypothetical protein
LRAEVVVIIGQNSRQESQAHILNAASNLLGICLVLIAGTA